MANYTLNYTGEKVDELLNKIDTAFGETTVMSDTLTWDGDTAGLVPVLDSFYYVSGATPTLEDCRRGGVIKAANSQDTNEDITSWTFTDELVMSSEEMGMGTGVILIQTELIVVIVTKDGATLANGNESVTIDKAGIYFMDTQGLHVSSFAINGYTFTETEIKTIDPKYIKIESVPQTFIINATGNYKDGTFALDKTLIEIMAAYSNGYLCFIKTESGRLIPLKRALVYGSIGSVWFEDIDVSEVLSQVEFFSIHVENMSSGDYTEVFAFCTKVLNFENYEKYEQ